MGRGEGSEEMGGGGEKETQRREGKEKEGGQEGGEGKGGRAGGRAGGRTGAREGWGGCGGERFLSTEQKCWSDLEPKEPSPAPFFLSTPYLPPLFSLWNIPCGPLNALGNCLANQGPHLLAETCIRGFT